MLLIECWKDHKGTVDWQYTMGVYKDLLEEHSYKVKQVGIADYLFY